MAAGKSSNTQSEALRGLLGQIADMKAMPDADINFLTNFETMLLGYLRAPFEQQQQQVSAMPGGPGGMSPSMQPMGAPAARVPGIMNSNGQPPVDELRRLLSA